MKKSKNQRNGFTLIELLVVIAIIGLLSGMVVISVSEAKAKSRDAQRVSEINNIATALALYHNDFNRYPTYTGRLTGTDAVSVTLLNAGLMSGIPLDPLNQDNPAACDTDTNGYHYYYESVDGSDFYMGYCLETNSVHGKTKGVNSFIP